MQKCSLEAHPILWIPPLCILNLWHLINNKDKTLFVDPSSEVLGISFSLKLKFCRRQYVYKDKE
jgi:hypothetical protein